MARRKELSKLSDRVVNRRRTRPPPSITMSDIVGAVGRRAALPRRHGVDKRLRKRGRGRRSPPGALKGIERAALLGFGAAREHNALKRDVARIKTVSI